MASADDAQPDAMAEASAREAIAGTGTADVERRALHVLPAGDAADHHAKVVAGHLVGREPVDADTGHTSRGIPLDDAQVAEPVATMPGGPQRPLNQFRPQFTRPRGLITARVVLMQV